MEAEPVPFNKSVWLVIPSVVYSTLVFGVPLKLILVDKPLQIVTMPVIVAAGKALTVTTAESVNGVVHTGTVAELTLTR